MKKIVLCGSIRFKDTMRKYKEILEKKGYVCVLPNELNQKLDEATLSRIHFNEIASQDTDAILVINEKKENIKNYIGLHTFSEIGLAFHYNRKIFLLNDMYTPLKAELTIWNVVPLKGDLEKLESK